MHPIPAATLILFRDSSSGSPELLMVERAKAMAFAGGAWVFPGGRVDPADEALAVVLAPDREDGPARIAAIRETLEETGVGVGFEADAAALAAIRDQLHAGEPFGAALSQAGATPDLSTLTAFARWLPAHRQTRVFDTCFFLAEAPAGARATVDATENTRLVWITARDMLAKADAGLATIIYPTRRTLERLARFSDIAAARGDAAAYPIRTITPFIERRGDVDHLCIPADLGYPITSEPFTAAVRG